MSTFKERHFDFIEENFGNDNRMKYLKGGLLGAGGLAAAHIMGGGEADEGILNTAKETYDQGGVSGLWNSGMGGIQKGLEWLKTDNSPGTPNITTPTAGTADINSNI